MGRIAGSESAAQAEALDARSASGGLYSRPLLLMLVLAYTTNFMDRTIVGTLAQAIKLDLKISDAQLGLLQGFAFVILYSLMGVPIARLSERRDRITIISVCMAVWSGMTMLCGTAQNFIQLLLFRVAVGVGEAGCNAPSHSIVADAFAPGQRARAISVYNLGVPIGTMIGAISGGLIAEHLSWRTAFVIVGAPGILLALAMRLTVRDPGRGSEPRPDDHVQVLPLARRLAAEPALRHLALGFMLTSFSAAGIGAFTQPYFIRAFGLSYAQIGVVFGLAGGIVVATSLLVSGRLADRAIARDARWHAWLPALGVAISIPFSLASFTVAPWGLALALGLIGHLFMNWYIAPTQSGLHRLVGARQVAMAMALVLMFQNLVGLGGGPLLAGVMIDGVAQHLWAGQGPGAFAAACPGGAAPQGASADLAQACADTLVRATRAGLLATTTVKLWAILHFFLAARHVRKALP